LSFSILFYLSKEEKLSKRNRIKIETKESRALKALRIKSGHSLSKLADALKVSKGRVHQYEQGREEINDTYISNFLEATGISASEWNSYIGVDCEFSELREKCIDRLSKIENSKLELVYGLLSNL
jgi:transcriptional regulator with XRE-family HTH domain